MPHDTPSPSPGPRRRPNEPTFEEAHRELYAKARAMITEEDLRIYETEEPMVPFEEVLAVLENQQVELERKRKPQ
jgi:hypothetical protein